MRKFFTLILLAFIASFTTVNAQVGCDYIYVVPGGATNGSGNINAPVTLPYALTLVSPTRNVVLMLDGSYSYSQKISVPANVIIDGRYQISGGEWVKNSAANTTITITPGLETVSGTGQYIAFELSNSDDVYLKDLNIINNSTTAGTTGSRGRTKYGIRVANSNNFYFTRLDITTSNASNGLGGSNGASGFNGGRGWDGHSGDADGNSCGGAGGVDDGEGGTGGGGTGFTAGANSCNGVTGSAGQNGPNFRHGGWGGGGGAGERQENNNDARNGGNGGFGSNGAVARGGAGSANNGDSGTGGSGGNGSGGANGGSSTAVNNFSLGAYFIPGAQSGSGQDGRGGGGAGGGGGGGAQAGSLVDNGAGSGGGGGGGGGQGGQGGTGGFGGGGNFGVYVSGGSANNLVDSRIAQGNAGNGGSGGTGGARGTGGTRGNRGTPNGGETGFGGFGGFGGDGGNGGNGANGANGFSAPTRSITQNGTSVPNPVTLITNVLGGCTNSEIFLSKSGGMWNLLSGAQFINDVDASTSSYNTSTGSVIVYYPSIGHKDVEVSATYDKYLYIKENRAAPVITPIVNPCGGSPALLTTATSGDQYEWIVFQTNTSNALATSTSQTFNYNPPSTGSYKVRLRVYDSCCGWSIPVYSTFSVSPAPNGDMSVVTPICLGDQTTITFDLTPGTGPFTVEFTDGVTPFTQTLANGGTFDVTPPTTVTYNFTSITDALGCSRTSGFTGNAQVVVNTLPIVSFSGLDASYCESDSPVLLTGNQAPGGEFTGTGITDLANGTATFDPTIGPGNYDITYEFENINSCSDDVTQSVNIEQQPTADAGSGGDECDLNFDLGANPSVASGSWSQTGGPGFSNFVPNANDPNATVSVSQYGSYEFTCSEGVLCSSSDGITVNFYEQPVANAGTNGNECDLTHVFNAVPSVGNGTWTQVSGPGTSTYADATSATTTVTATVSGQYVYQWEEVNGTCSDAATVTVNFFEQPVANPGFGGSECDLNFQLGATPSVGIGTWSATGPGTITFTPSATDPNAVAEVSTYGIYIFTWSEDNFGCVDDASITVNFDQQTNANAGDDGNECDLNFTFNGSTSIGTGVWTYAGPGNAFFSNQNSPTATVTVDTYGSYVFTWTETNGSCTATDIATVNFYEQPVANAGTDADECDLNHTFDAVASVGDGLWLQTNGPGTSTFLVDSDPTTTVTVDQYGTYTYSWTETNGTCSDNATVVVAYYEQPVADAGSGGDECDLDFSLTGVASVGTGLWTYSGPGTATFVNDISAATDVSVSAYGTYIFTWTETNGTCSDASSVTVNFYEQPVAVTGLGGDECGLEFLTAAVPSVGTGLWTQTSGPGTAVFSSASSAINLITVDTYGTYEFTWTETNGTCIDFRTITVNFYEQPVAEAGLGGDECDLDFTLAASASVGSGEWTYTGPGTAVFGSSTSASTTATVSQSGVYTFTWTETNGVCSDSDDATVIFYDQPVANAGTGGDECDLNFTFNAVPSFGTGTWTYTGPGIASFTNANGATSTVNVDTYGAYEFTWTEVNGICSDVASVTVNFYEQPVADAGSAVNQCDLDYSFNGTASVGVGTWTYTGPGTATFSPNENDVNATVTVDATGAYTFTWTEDNNGCTDSDDVSIEFNPLPVVSFTGLDANYCVDFSTPVALSGTPAGGTFSGLGVSGSSFVPSVAGVGTIFITYTYTDVNGCTDSETQSVDVNGLPTVSFSGLDLSYCEDDATAYTLTGTPVGGTFTGPGIAVDAFTPSVANNGNHVITYSYSDPFGCTSSNQQSVTVNELPVVSFTGLSASYCEDASSAALIGSPSGGTFSGPGISGNSFSPVDAGTGTHVVVYTYTDGSGCTNTSSQQVVVNDVPVPVVAPAGTSEICAGETLTLDAGAGFANYSWSNGASGQIITVSTADDYNVTVTTVSGCVGTSADVTVVVNSLPVVDLGQDTIVCTGSTYTIDAGNPGLDYAWSTFEISQTITVSTTGNYEVAVTDQNGCVGTDEVLVSVSSLLEPVIVANGPVEFCAGGSVTLDGGAGYGSYQWSTGETTQSITVSTPGLYEVTVVDQFGCSGADDEIVSVLQLPNAVIQPGGPIEICSSDTVTLFASNTFASYEWTPSGATSSSIDVFQTGTYTVTVTDPNNGCVATSAPVSVTVNSSVPPTIVPSGATEFCDGESVSLSVAPGPYSSFLWSSGSTTPSIVVTQTGDYGVTVLDANGCLDSTLQGNPLSVTVWDPQPQVEQQGETLVVVNGPFAQYQWYFNGSPIPGAVADSHVPAQSGNYYVEAWDGNDCSGNSFNVEYTFTGIVDLTNLYDINVYPNPTNGTFYLEVDFGKRVTGEISLIDMTGRAIIIPEQVSDVSSIRRQFDIENLSLGVYYLRLVTQDGVAVVSVVRN